MGFQNTRSRRGGEHLPTIRNISNVACVQSRIRDNQWEDIVEHQNWVPPTTVQGRVRNKWEVEQQKMKDHYDQLKCLMNYNLRERHCSHAADRIVHI
ncbi:hypothetical protein Trydic_g15978 [Trypoxylus dichotomus]